MTARVRVYSRNDDRGAPLYRAKRTAFIPFEHLNRLRSQGTASQPHDPAAPFARIDQRFPIDRIYSRTPANLPPGVRDPLRQRIRRASLYAALSGRASPRCVGGVPSTWLNIIIVMFRRIDAPLADDDLRAFTVMILKLPFQSRRPVGDGRGSDNHGRGCRTENGQPADPGAVYGTSDFDICAYAQRNP